MSKKDRQRQTSASARKQSPWALPMIGLIVLAFAVGIIFLKQQGGSGVSEAPPTASPFSSGTPETIIAQNPTGAPPTPETRPASELQHMKVNTAVMVTAELDFGPQVPSIAQALTEIDRRYEPSDGEGRTFAVLDAYGDRTANNKLHVSMHVSSEKPGTGSLVFRRTGEVLWKSVIETVPGATSGKNLVIYVADPQGATWMIDGSNGAKSILDAKLRDKPSLVRDFWPDGAEREVTFVYSACGCPVKVMARRTGDRTVRTKELPVIFPDDPAAVLTISRLMGW
jgi:hypothetical protein